MIAYTNIYHSHTPLHMLDAPGDAESLLPFPEGSDSKASKQRDYELGYDIWWQYVGSSPLALGVHSACHANIRERERERERESIIPLFFPLA